MSGLDHHDSQHSVCDREFVDQVCDRFEALWLAGQRPHVEEFLNEVAPPIRPQLLTELLLSEWDLRRASEEPIDLESYLNQFPRDHGTVRDAYDRWTCEASLDMAGDTTPADGSPVDAAPSTMDDLPGYEIEGVLGRGGMGVVYKARDLRLKRQVALKMILSGEFASDEQLGRFASEAEAVAAIRHANIVQVYEVGSHRGRAYMALELVTNGSLAERLSNGPLTHYDAARLVELAARGMAAAHDKDVVHRDLKPANILIDADGTPKITDFGLAKRVQEDSGLTHTGVLLGTPSYMAPEQALGGTRTVGPAADVYSLGAVLYECLTGRPPFQGDTPAETVMQVVDGEPLRPRQLRPNVPRDLETICMKCLSQSPEKRFASASDLAEDLRRWQSAEPILARPSGRIERAVKWCRRRPAAAALVMVSTLATLALLLGGVYFTDQLREQRDAALALKADAEKKEKEAIAQRKRAELGEKAALEEASKAQEVAAFMDGIFEDSELFGLSGRSFGVLPRLNPSMRDVLDRGKAKLLNDRTLSGLPLVRATLLNKVGNAYLSLGEIDDAEALLNEAAEARRSRLPPTHPDVVTSMNTLAFLKWLRGDRDGAEADFRTALALRREIHGDNHPLTLETELQLGVLYWFKSEWELSDKHLLRVLAARRKSLAAARENGSDDIEFEVQAVAAALAIITSMYAQCDRVGDAEQYLVELRSLMDEVLDQDKAQLVRHMVDANVLQGTGLLGPANKQFKLAVEKARALLGSKHYLLAVFLTRHGYCLFEQERYEEAEVAWRESVELMKEYHPGGSRYEMSGSYQFARCIARGRAVKYRNRANELKDDPKGYQEQMDRYREAIETAESLARRALVLDKTYAGTREQTATYAWFLAHLLLYHKEPPELDEAQRLVRLAWESRCHVHGYDHVLATGQLSILTNILAQQRRFDELEQCFEQHMANATTARKWRRSRTQLIVQAAEMLAQAGRIDTALALLREAVHGGFDANELRERAGLEGLHSKAEFQQLLSGTRPDTESP